MAVKGENLAPILISTVSTVDVLKSEPGGGFCACVKGVGGGGTQSDSLFLYSGPCYL